MSTITEPQYRMCAHEGCPFFVEVNSSHEDDPDNIAPWVHLTRGDANDDDREDHEAIPGIEERTLEWWREHGPRDVRARFITTDAEIIERAKIERPINWDDMGSSARDLWEERQIRSIVKTATPLDVWLLFDDPEDEEASHEANIFYTENREFAARWYNNAVGLVTERTFVTYGEAAAWLEDSGYQDFSS